MRFKTFLQFINEQAQQPETLALGAKGDAVKALQQKLIDLKLLKIKEPTGYYGNLTKAAVEQFQGKNGLAVDGIVGRETYPKLMGTTNTTASKSTALKKDFTSTIKFDTVPLASDTFKQYSNISSVKPLIILKKIESKNKEDGSSDSGVVGFLRKIWPNIFQLLSAQKLTDSNFTSAQKKVILSAILNSQKRNPSQKTKGSTEYIDYGEDVANTFANKRGSPSMWEVVWNTMTMNTSFAIATLLGRFSWKKESNGSYTVTDKYDFKDPAYNELIGVNRKDLEGLSITELQNKYSLNPYEAARTKGWVDHPDTIPEKSLPIILTIDPKHYV